MPWPAGQSSSLAGPAASASPRPLRSRAWERVGLVGRDESRANGAAERLGRPARVDVFTADLSAQREVELAATVLEAYPRLDVLVNNVGGSGRPGT